MKVLKAILIATLIFISAGTFAQTTTIWLVRHGEKATSTDNDPDLNAEGKARAIALANQLKNQKIAAVFTTPYKRTTQTGEPVVKQFGLAKIQNYEVADLTGLAKQILQEYAGKEVLVIGHSNTIIPTLKAFGPINHSDLLDDEDYDLLFKLTIKDGKITGLEVRHYGVPHHSDNSLPVNTMVPLN